MVYRSVYQAAREAPSDARYLVTSMHVTEFKGPQFWRAFRRRWLMARRFRDCEIHSYCEAIVLAFHLSIVSVMILESVTPQFYELLWPQTGAVYASLGGIGRRILVAQQRYDVQLIAGYVWAVIVFDFFAVTVIEYALHRRWRQHYAEEL
jgi:hypothetical protein